MYFLNSTGFRPNFSADKATVLSAILLSFVLTGSAYAAPITWTLSGANYDSPTRGPAGSLTGSFQFDADTNTYSNVNLDTANFGTLTSPGTCLNCASGTFFEFTDGTGDLNDEIALELSFGGALTDAGGRVNLSIAAVIFCANASCTSGGTDDAPFSSHVQSGAVATPEPPPAA